MKAKISAVALAAAMAAGPVLAQDSLTVALQLEPPHLDPTSAAAGAIDQVVYANIFEGLTRFGPDGSVNPGLASSWEISEDGLTYTFHLVEGAKFHDGTDFEATDVVFSLDRARGEDSVNAQKTLFAGIESVEAVDPATVKVTLSAPDGLFLFKMAWGDAVIVAPESIDDIKTAPVGTGAFTFDGWVQGDSISLAKNPDYWGEPAMLDAATFKYISDPTAGFAAMMAGDVDAFVAFPAPENLPQFDADPRFKVLIGSTEGETILAMNNGREPFSNKLVREAVAHAINRQDIIDGAMFGYGTPIGTFFAPHNPDYVDLTGLSDYDPEKSKALLEEAGVALPLKVKMTLPPPSYARRGGEIVAAQLRAVGIEPEIENVEWAQWLENTFRNAHDYDLTIISHTEPMDINAYANPDYYFQYDNPAFQDVMAKLDVESDPAVRSELLKSAQTMLAEDYVSGFLFELPLHTVAKTGVEGLWVNMPTQATDLTGVYWEK
ncbi:peptide/nickel transport system substrate-binding protein [Pseudooceanicola antarcticus]|uniref:ABC transporter substrate-binding protein n=1 Tax=Pseudooceanicola antarcticus TaxID=1247613 RepID=A0A285HML3_9RHOB|nr:ABC transporter substrate-binding protein [Pseudooceanicola antarcticus]PJE27911.1 ABC transporter substrate-binding protein [Pseudooceanicola antarcticus]SNY36006.1 peptide/nickel transport system substrate-binding protein [Pseudooceanicola antarcticus]